MSRSRIKKFQLSPTQYLRITFISLPTRHSIFRHISTSSRSTVLHQQLELVPTADPCSDSIQFCPSIHPYLIERPHITPHHGIRRPNSNHHRSQRGYEISPLAPDYPSHGHRQFHIPEKLTIELLELHRHRCFPRPRADALEHQRLSRRPGHRQEHTRSLRW